MNPKIYSQIHHIHFSENPKNIEIQKFYSLKNDSHLISWHICRKFEAGSHKKSNENTYYFANVSHEVSNLCYCTFIFCGVLSVT